MFLRGVIKDFGWQVAKMIFFLDYWEKDSENSVQRIGLHWMVRNAG